MILSRARQSFEDSIFVMERESSPVYVPPHRGEVFGYLPHLDAFHHVCSTAFPRFSAFEWRYFIVVFTFLWRSCSFA